MTQIPPFWAFALALVLLLAFYDAFPQAGGALLIVIVLGALLLYERQRKASA